MKKWELPVLAGVGYTVAWLVGLSISGPSPAVDADNREILSAYVGHRSATAWQASLVQGLAGLLLLVVVLAVGRRAAAAGAAWPARSIRGFGIAAVLLSEVQFGLSGLLASGATPGSSPYRAGLLFEAVSRLDGVKMFALAGLALSVGLLGRQVHALVPNWLQVLCGTLAVTIVLSGIGYLLLIPALASVAYLSGVVLLAWVPAATISFVRPESPELATQNGDSGRTKRA